VMNSPEQVAPETAERVRAAIERLGYVPNLLAGGLSSRRSRIVAAIVPTIASPMFSASVQAFTDALDAAGYHVVLGLSGYGAGEEALIAAILGRRPDGLLLTGAERSPATRRRLAMAGVPVVEIWDLTENPTDMIVGFDHRAVGAAVATYFLDRGYRRFAIIAADDPRANARREGFTAGLPPGAPVFDRRVSAPAFIQGGRDAMVDIPLSPHEPTALFCSSDLPAAGAVIEAALRGIAVPGQLAVCGFGDFELAAALTPSVTTVSVDGAEIGRVAAAALLGRLAGQVVARKTVVPFRIVERGSTLAEVRVLQEVSGVTHEVSESRGRRHRQPAP
jgi:LacI family gluconate utilization system Gnt-I transcriptional repressor